MIKSHQRKIAITGAVVIASFCALLAYSLRDYRLKYHGRPVISWVRAYTRSTDGAMSKELSQMGSLAYPYLKRELSMEESAISKLYEKFYNKAPAFLFRHLPQPIDPDRVRQNAMWGIITIGGQGMDIVPDLLACLNDPSENIRLLALNALAKRPESVMEAIPLLKQSITNVSSNYKIEYLAYWEKRTQSNEVEKVSRPGGAYPVESCRLLWKLSPDDKDFILPVLLKQFHNLQSSARVEAAELLFEIAPSLLTAYVPELIALCRSEGNATTFRFLGALGPVAREGASILVQGLKYPDSGTRMSAAGALGQIDAPSALVVPALIAALADENDAVRGNACISLGSFGLAAVNATPKLLSLMSEQRYYSRVYAAGALWRIDPAQRPQCIPVFEQALSSTNRFLKSWALGELWRIGPTADLFVPQITELIGDSDLSVQIGACKAVLAIDSGSLSTIVPILEKLKHSTNEYVVREASRLLQLQFGSSRTSIP
jgi:HEAT repeat protein